MDEDAEGRTDRETVVETYLKKLEWAGIEIDRQRYPNNDLQPTMAAGSDIQASAAIIAPISSPQSAPCSPNKASAINRMPRQRHYSDLWLVQPPPPAVAS
jgi:hypothetical protein